MMEHYLKGHCFRKAPHNSYITYENIEKGAEKAGYEMTIPPAKMEFLDEGKVENIQVPRSVI